MPSPNVDVVRASLTRFTPLVLAVGRMHMRGEGTGMAFETPAAFQFTVGDGSIVRVEVFMDVEEGWRRTQEGVPGT